MFLNKELLFLLLLFPLALIAQKKEIVLDTVNNNLEEVIITATRTKRKLATVAMPVTLISKQQLKQSGSVRLSDIIVEQTGIVIVSDVGNSEGVQMQGIAADYVLIMIDGVPVVGRTAGNIDLERLTVNNIKQIEIVKGPSSSLYGSEALGGVINIITEQPLKEGVKGDFSLFTRVGPSNELDINTNISAKKEKFGVVAGVNLNSSKGFDLSPETPTKTAYPHQNITSNLQVTYEISQKIKALASGRFYNQNQNQLTTTNSQTDWNVNTKFTHKFSEVLSFDYTFYATRFKTKSIFNNETALFNRSLFRPEIRAKYKRDKSTVIGGVGINYDALVRTAFDSEKKYEAQYVFAQYEVFPVDGLSLVFGARFDKHNKYKSAFSPKVAFNAKLTNWLTLKSSMGYGFKAPDFRQLYFNFRNVSSGYIVLGTQTLHNEFANVSGVNMIEKELKPENSIGYNLGFQLKPSSKLNIGINLFRNNISDLIDVFDTQLNPNDLGLTNGTRTFSYQNIDEIYTQGVEVDFKYHISNNVKILGGYQYLETANKKEEQFVAENPTTVIKDENGVSKRVVLDYFGLANRSKHHANLKLFYENFIHNFSANVRAVYRSKYALFDTNGNGLIDSYDNFVSDNLQLNFAVNKQVSSTMKLQFGVDNLTDERGEVNKEKFKNNDTVLRLGRTFYGRLTINI
ncbi:MAG: TonB-dependent receptor plug domain-containing protein [Tenacibaculum sp.]